MHENLALQFMLICLLGSVAQWLAWRIKVPSILFLMFIGIALGPGLGWIKPSELFGNGLFPVISLAVSVILFEGSLTLELAEIEGLEKIVRRSITTGVLIVWLLISAATHFIMQFPWTLSCLFGALVVVTGPTVIAPLLRTVKPKPKLANILKWEGILIDPIGAILAVLVFSVIVSNEEGAGVWQDILLILVKTLGVGISFGFIFSTFLGYLLKHHLVPEYLQSYMSLSLVFANFVCANQLQPESGLLAVTVMGLLLANKKNIEIDHILNFKESLSILLISGLFIILSARLNTDTIMEVGWPGVWVTLFIQFIARPLKIAIVSWRTDLSWNERLLLSWIAPRGIVAAAISAIFALKLEKIGYPKASLLVPLTFLVVIGTVTLQSLTARPLALWLGVAMTDDNGVLIIGANPVAQAIALALSKQNISCLLVDSRWNHVRDTRMAGLDVFYGHPISQYASYDLDTIGRSKMLALSEDDLLNVLAIQRYRSEFGKHNCFSLSPETPRAASDKHGIGNGWRGDILFSSDASYDYLTHLLSQGGKIRATKLSDNFDFQMFQDNNQATQILLFAISPQGELIPFIQEKSFVPKSGWTILSLS